MKEWAWKSGRGELSWNEVSIEVLILLEFWANVLPNVSAGEFSRFWEYLSVELTLSGFDFDVGVVLESCNGHFELELKKRLQGVQNFWHILSSERSPIFRVIFHSDQKKKILI